MVSGVFLSSLPPQEPTPTRENSSPCTLPELVSSKSSGLLPFSGSQLLPFFHKESFLPPQICLNNGPGFPTARTSPLDQEQGELSEQELMTSNLGTSMLSPRRSHPGSSTGQNRPCQLLWIKSQERQGEAPRSSWELLLPFQRIVSSTASSFGPIGSGLLQAPSLQIGVCPVACVGLEEQGERQRDLQQPSSPHGAAGRHSRCRRRRRAFPASPGSRCLAVPLSCCREVPAWVLPLSSPGTAPTSGSPCLSCNTEKSPRPGGDTQGSGMLKAHSPRCRAQPARGAVTRRNEDRSIPAGCRARARRLASTDPVASRRQVPRP